MLACLHEERFQDCSPAQVYAALLDEGQFHCSIRTMYRLLETHGESRERRDQLSSSAVSEAGVTGHPANQLWSWDITKLRGPVKWTCYHLYVILDVFSRYVVGWMIAYRESAELAKRLIEHTCRKQQIAARPAHRPRRSRLVDEIQTRGFVAGRSGRHQNPFRPHVSDDNPYSESQFRTLKYRPGFPDRFGSIEDARGFCQSFFHWYNHQHHHSGLGLMTPAVVHLGKPRPILLIHRQAVLDTAFRLTPNASSADSQAAGLPPRSGSTSLRPEENSLNFYPVCLILIDTHRRRDQD